MSERRRMMMSAKKENVIDVIDLGLPSGLLWSTTNLGGNTETDFGLYFSYGNVGGHEVGSYSFTSANYRQTRGYGLNGNIPANSTYDAATAALGDGWRMPTMADFRELIENCTKVWTSDYQGSGIAGVVFTSKRNGKKIFLVGGGYTNGTTRTGADVFLRESTQYDTGHGYLARINTNSSDYNFIYGDKYTGVPIRPVKTA